MRPFLIAVFLAGAFATNVAAQTCASVVSLNNIRLAAGAECRFSGGPGTACRAGVPVTVEVDATWSSNSLPPCPDELTWHFGDGTPDVKTAAPRVQHTFNAGHLNILVYRTTSPHIVAGDFAWMVWGWFSLQLDRTRVREDEAPLVATIRRDETSHAGAIYYHTGPAPYVTEKYEQIHFAPGEAAKQVLIPIVNDDVWRGDSHTAYIDIFNPTGYGPPENDRSWFTIEEDDAPITHTFAQRAATVSEGGTLQLEVVRGGNLTGTTTAVVTAVGQSKELTFAAGESRHTAQFTIPDNAAWRGNSFASARVWGKATPNVVDEIEVTVFEDEPIPTITPGSIEITETNGAQTLAIELTATPPFDSTSFQVSAADATAGDGDYAFGARSYFWSGSTLTLNVTIFGDTIAENDETFHLELIAPVVEHLVTVRILDDDRPPFGFELDSPNYTFPEAGGNITVRRTGDAGDAARLILSFLPRSTLPFPDSMTIDFAAGETSKSVFLPTQDDWYTGDRDATIELEWNGFKGASAYLTVVEDEPMPRLSVGDASVNEGASGETPHAEVALTLSGKIGTDLFVGIAIENLTASHDDYGSPAPRAHFTPGALRAVLRVPIRGDDAREANETLLVKVTSCCDRFATVERDRAVVTILNDDGGDSSAYALDVAGSVNESAKWLVAYVTRTQTNLPATATVRLTADDARTFPPVTARFKAGESRAEVRFLIDDGYYSGSVKAQLEVRSGTRVDDRRSVQLVEDEPTPVVRVGDVTLPVYTQPRPVAFPITVEPPSWKPIQLQLRTAPFVGNARFDRIERIETIPSLASRVEITTNAAFSSPGPSNEAFQLTASPWPVDTTQYVIKKPTGTCTLQRIGTNVAFAP
ncbi:MAG TPA: Calx-beta domain-containing protein, partial [Thermoanaerobaculia bacterium]|nr:Calx-beta domain-containing protein [Thermoanaerobaculia bacterium]